MIDLKYSLVIEATSDAKFFCFYSPDLEGFTGAGRSVDDCLCRAKEGMDDFVEFLREEGLPIPRQNPAPQVLVQNDVRAKQA